MGITQSLKAYSIFEFPSTFFKLDGVMRHVFLNCLVCVSILFSCGESSAQQLHAVIVGDISPSTGFGKYVSAVKNDLLGLSMALEENVPKSRINLCYLEIQDDEDSSPDIIRQALRDMKANANDTILFYYSGHGSVDDKGHYLSLAHGKLYREELIKLLKAKGARLVALVTDCCSTRSDGYLYMAPNYEIPCRRSPTPLFQKLFFDSRGFVDINSASPGESAFFAPYREGEVTGMPGSEGSIFTIAWLQWLDQEKQNQRSWDDMVRAVSLKTHKAFRDFYPKGASIAKGAPIQTDQNVYPFTYPGKPANEGPRTGIIIRDFTGRNSVITEVTPGSPATQVFLLRKDQFISLQPQQVVVAINGAPTPDTRSVVQEINASPQIMRMTIRDARQGTFDVLLRMKY